MVKNFSFARRNFAPLRVNEGKADEGELSFVQTQNDFAWN